MNELEQAYELAIDIKLDHFSRVGEMDKQSIPYLAEEDLNDKDMQDLVNEMRGRFTETQVYTFMLDFKLNNCYL